MAGYAVFSLVLVSAALSGFSEAGLLPNLVPDLVDGVVVNGVVDGVVNGVVVDGVLNGVVPDLTQMAPPVNKEDAKSRVVRGCETGKGGLNVLISLQLSQSMADPSLTPECKKCIAQRAATTRQNAMAQCDGVSSALTSQIDSATESTLLSVWTTIAGALSGSGGTIQYIVSSVQQDLISGKCDCMYQTMNQTCPNAAA